MVEESQVARVLEMVWNSTLGLEVRPWDSSILTPDKRQMLAASVRISGAWGGTICIHAPDVLARQAAARMFNIPYLSVTEADVQDAFGELANQVGGNLKALLPTESHLSMPSVMDGAQFLADLTDAELLMEFTAESGGLPIVITMIETLPARDDVLARFYSLETGPG